MSNQEPNNNNIDKGHHDHDHDHDHAVELPPAVTPTTPPLAPPPGADVEGGGGGGGSGSRFGFGVGAITRRWRREDMMRKGSVWLRGLALFFSFISFVVMASNEHGDWKDFDRYEEFRYVLAIAILSTLYTGLQIGRYVYEVYGGRQFLDRHPSLLVDFIGDQIVAYLLVSSASSAVPMTDRMRVRADNIFTDALSASIAMSFLAFLALALSALISGHKLSIQSYV